MWWWTGNGTGTGTGTLWTWQLQWCFFPPALVTIILWPFFADTLQAKTAIVAMTKQINTYNFIFSDDIYFLNTLTTVVKTKECAFFYTYFFKAKQKSLAMTMMMQESWLMRSMFLHITWSNYTSISQLVNYSSSFEAGLQTAWVSTYFWDRRPKTKVKFLHFHATTLV